MVAFLASLTSFVNGLLAVEVPLLGCTMRALLCGLWIFYAVGYFVIRYLFGK